MCTNRGVGRPETSAERRERLADAAFAQRLRVVRLSEADKIALLADDIVKTMRERGGYSIDDALRLGFVPSDAQRIFDAAWMLAVKRDPQLAAVLE